MLLSGFCARRTRVLSHANSALLSWGGSCSAACAPFSEAARGYFVSHGVRPEQRCYSLRLRSSWYAPAST
jgi:hypothetical protein